MANPKVFEFAKEVGMETLALMAKIRDWQLPIKSHMAELTPDLVDQIRNRLNPHAASEASKKLTVKKKATVKKVVASEPQSQPVVISGGSAPKVVRRKATSELEASKKSDIDSSRDEIEAVEESFEKVEHISVATDEVVEKPISIDTKTKEASEDSSKLLVKEKLKVQEAEIPVAPVEKIVIEAPAQVISVKESKPAVEKQSSSTEKQSSPIIETPSKSIPAPVLAKVDLDKKKTNIVGQVAVPSTPQVKKPRFETPQPKNQVSPEESERRAPPPPARKKEVVVGQSGFASSQKPANEVVRKNIVGRMDLSRVTPPPREPQSRGYQGSGQPRTGGYQGNNNSGGGYQGGQQRTGYQGNNNSSGGGGGYQGNNNSSGGFQGGNNTGGYQGGGGGFRPQTPGGPLRTAGRNNLRAGFVAQPIPVIPELEDASRRSKFEDKHKKFTKPAPEMGAAVVPEEEQVQFNSAEFRKREMVFQPKKKKGTLAREGMRTQITTPKASKRILKINGKMKLGDVAESIGIKAAQLTKALMQNGVMGNINSELDFDTLSLILPDFGWEAQNVFKTADEILEDTAFGDLTAPEISRPPVVTVMGHVDHGKTSLLDAIRQADVAAGEKGGITQHIGAYQVKLETGELVTFLDTPGHEAFTAMRARGANATDIAVIVIAADDGVMPQTAEAINHAKAAGVPIVIALNKMDKPGANPDRIKQQLTEFEIVPEEWGGSNIFCEVSAFKKEGIKELLVQLLLVAEMQELTANPKRSGTGVVIESRLEKGRGSTATILVQDGTVSIGDLIVAGTCSGKVRSLMNDLGERVEFAGPGMPVEVLGLSEVPGAGDKFDIVKDEKTMERVVDIRKALKIKDENPSSKMTIEEIFSRAKQGDQKILNVILKSDVMGSAEAIQGMFQKVATQEVKIKIIHSAVGGINEGDVLLASTSKAIVLGFNTRPDGNALALAKRKGVEVRTYGIVYEMMDDLKRLMVGLLEPEIVEQVHGRAEVRSIFTVPKAGTIGGCSVLDGKVARAHLVRLVRNGVVVYQGKIGSLKRFKDDAKEVAAGFECGIGIENFNDLKIGDIIEAYTREEIRRSLTETSASV